MSGRRVAEHRPDRLRSAGFTLIEVLIALVVVAVGVLGLAKMQASSLASTQVNGGRALVAFQAGSLAAAMHSNLAFWGTAAAVNTFSIQGTAVTDSSGVLSATGPSCASASLPAAALCTPAQLAAFDVRSWAAGMNQLFPTYSATGNCAAPPNAPISCQLTVRWLERFVSGSGRAATDSDGTGGQRSYTLYIEP